ncbi:C2 domain-containing protein [Hibiscus syriacus]|uniref:C2 domain-containing protein n=1 Tax=Hibiscus syriacus TaxID=106335 RepID=A0A6A2YPB5_HIBSY|nr:C2 domain-containing protein At1g53590-like [Hibiscus syriacus]KAE8681137.1 C2 domain-containing protein [Hibiscus syriacus]
MGLMEISIMLHVGLVLMLLWMLSHYNLCHPLAYLVSLIYLYLVHESYVTRLRKKLEFEEKRQSFRRRVLSDSESVRWLNHAVEKMWPICMEQITSQKILLPIIPWFLDKYKPWTAENAVVQHLYLGRNPPLFTDMRVLRECSDDDHLVLELGMNFLTADDMSAILAVKLRKRLGGMSAKLHVTGMHVEGKVLIGVKFIRKWPFLGRLRVCFAEPPYFQMTVKPILPHGLDVTELPGIAGWLDKLLSTAFEQTLVEPNMLVVDVEKFASPSSESWFSVHEKQPIAHAKVEVIEASDMKPSDLNGLADPYVKGTLGPYRFRTKTHKKTLSPKWHEEFMIPICSWETPNVMVIEVQDKDHLFDDSLGNCSVNVTELRGGQRHDMWLPLRNIKMGRLHLAITVVEDNAKVTQGSDDADHTVHAETLNKEDIQVAFATKDADNGLFSPSSSLKSPTLPDHLEPIDVEGQQETGIWVHHPGSEVSQTWEPRKGKVRSLETQIHRVPNGSFGSTISAATGSIKSDDSSSEENPNSKNRVNMIKQGLRKIGSLFQRSPKSEGYSGNLEEVVPSPHENLRAVNDKDVLVKFVVDDNLLAVKVSNDGSSSPGGSSAESPRKMKDMAKSILKHAGNSAAHGIKHVFSRKGSKKSRNLSAVEEQEFPIESESDDDDDSLSSPGVRRMPVLSNPISSASGNDGTNDHQEHVIQADSNNQLNPETNAEGQVEQTSVEGQNGVDEDEADRPVKLANGSNEPPRKPNPSEGNSECEKKVENPQTDTEV